MKELTEEAYASRVERLYERVLRQRMVACLERLSEAYRAAGYVVSGPNNMSTDEYEWSLTVEGNGLPQPVGVDLTLVESAQSDSTLDGVNMALDIVAYGGEVIGGMTPYNYTERCWASLRDVHDVVERMQLIEDADPESAVKLVTDWATAARVRCLG